MRFGFTINCRKPREADSNDPEAYTDFSLDRHPTLPL